MIISDGVTTLGGSVFLWCEELSYVKIPDSVVEIGGSCFGGCVKLTSAGEIGSGSSIEFGWKENIPEHAFTSNCLTEIKLPDSIKYLYASCFSTSKSLKSIVIPSNVKYIDNNAFAYCPVLESVYFEGHKPGYLSTMAFYGGNKLTAYYTYKDDSWIFCRKILKM